MLDNSLSDSRKRESTGRIARRNGLRLHFMLLSRRAKARGHVNPEIEGNLNLLSEKSGSTSTEVR